MYKVCFVDDETINYQLFEKMVPWEEKGFLIAGTAADGLEALQMYEQVQPDLIFMDIQLPLMAWSVSAVSGKRIRRSRS